MNTTRRCTHEDRFRSRGGRLLTLRESTNDDIPALREFFGELSDQSRRLRFFASTRRVDEKILRGMVRKPGTVGTCVLACDATDGAIVGAVQYAPDGPGAAEVAVAVADALHGEGIGTELLHRAAAYAVDEGIVRFTAMVLAENNEMLHVFRDCGLPSSCRMNGPIDQVVIELVPHDTEPAGANAPSLVLPPSRLLKSPSREEV